MKEKWVADFSKPEKSCFDIKPEISHNANLENGSLFLGLKKKNSMTCLETADRVYVDQYIDARFRFDDLGGHCAAGVMFRIIERGTYYLALLSSKGYFRLDAVTKDAPQPLVGWTETPGFSQDGVSLGIIARGDHFIFLLNGKWIAEVRDDSIPGGHLGFALVSYDTDSEEEDITELYSPGEQPPLDTEKENYVCKAWLDFLQVDSRQGAVGVQYRKWDNNGEIGVESRLRLAESYAALERFASAYDQILKVWKQREDAARSVMATFTDMRGRGELIFAARMVFRLGQYETAQEYIDACLAMGEGGADGLDALTEKAIILNVQNKYDELAAFLPDYIKRINAEEDSTKLPPLYGLLGHAFWNLNDYRAAANAWDMAFSLNGNNGLYAVKAADAYEMLGKNAEALQRRLDGGNCLLQQKETDELGVLVPKLLAVGKKSWEAHALAGKWAFVIGDFNRAEAELVVSDGLRRALNAKTKAAAGSSDKASAKKTTGAENKTAKGKTPAGKTSAEKTKAKPKAAAKPAAKKPAAKAPAASRGKVIPSPKTTARPKAPKVKKTPKKK